MCIVDRYGFVAMTVEIVRQVAIVAFMHDQNYCVVSKYIPWCRSSWSDNGLIELVLVKF